MAGKVRHLINRSGRYHARLVVPKDLRKIVGKTELRTSLGADYRHALRLLPGAVAQLQHQFALAERKAGQGRQPGGMARYPMAPDQIALSHYTQRLTFDDELRNVQHCPAVGIDDMLVNRLRDAIAGRASDSELSELVGAQIKRFRAAGNLDAEPGSDEWRLIARALCSAELEALARVVERDKGDYTGTPSIPLLVNAQPPKEPQVSVEILKLWSDYVVARQKAGLMRDGGKRQEPVVKSLCRFLGHQDSRRVERKNVLEWRDDLLGRLSARTVSDVYLSTIRSLFGWALDNGLLNENPTENVRQRKPRLFPTRERGYTDDEAANVIKSSRLYRPNQDVHGRAREKPHLVAAKNWVPIICAFSGALVSEITQLRREDLRQVDDQWVARITPDAGTVKAGGYRDIPLHRQIITEGFGNFLDSSKPGPLFHGGVHSNEYAKKSACLTSAPLGQI